MSKIRGFFLFLFGSIIGLGVGYADLVVHKTYSVYMPADTLWYHARGDTIGYTTGDSLDYTDTFQLDGTTVGRGNSVDMIYGTFTMNALDDSGSAAHPYGGDDSATLTLFSVFNGIYHAIGTTTDSGLPLTLHVAIPSAAGTDTLIKENLALSWRYYDTVLFHDDVISITIDADYFTRGK